MARTTAPDRIWQRLSMIFMLGFVLSAVLTPLTALPASARDRVGYATKRLQVWSERDRQSEVVVTLPREAELTITGRAQAGFYPVRVDDVAGWALTGSVAVAIDGPNANRRAGRSTLDERQAVATEPVNLRAGPGTNKRIQTIIPAGRELTLTGQEQGDFVGVRFGSATGWVAKQFVRTGSSQSSASQIADAPVETGSNVSTENAPPVLKGNPRHMTPEDIIPFIYAAADYYGQPREDMLRVAQCESDLVTMAVNAEGGSYGIFQFKTGTWLSTPYAEYDIFDPRANAYAAGWMWSVGRRNEWVCQ